jgi:hypothetical protein
MNMIKYGARIALGTVAFASFAACFTACAANVESDSAMSSQPDDMSQQENEDVGKATEALGLGPCYDYTKAQPTPVHYEPSDSTPTVEFKNAGEVVTGNCVYMNNTSENRWYMKVNYNGHDNNGGFGYIWVQRLSFGSEHGCAYNDLGIYPIPSANCRLTPW